MDKVYEVGEAIEVYIGGNSRHQDIFQQNESGEYFLRYTLGPASGDYRGTWLVGERGYLSVSYAGMQDVRIYFAITQTGLEYERNGNEMLALLNTGGS